MLTLFMAACSNDTIIHEVQLPLEAVMVPRPIAFDMHAGNVTRAITEMNRANHYEFGVFATSDAPYDSIDAGLVMHNYLVGYGRNEAYMPWFSQMATDTADTKPATSKSAWVYTTLGSNDPLGPQVQTPMTKSNVSQQTSKYWDLGTDRYFFHAYTPYMPTGDATQPGTLTLGNDKQGEYMHFNGLRAFYTDPVVQTGIEAGTQTASGYDASKSMAGNNSEIINANEALYAANTIDPHNYVSDVSLIFKHVNAKVRIAFWEDIPGYSITMMDLVPEDVSITCGSGQPSYQGIAFTPATQAMTAYPDPQTPAEKLSTYYSQAQVRIHGIAHQSIDTRTNFQDIQVGDAANDQLARANLRFLCPADTLGQKREKATFSPTVYYPLPNYESSLPTPAWITDTRDGQQVAAQTGFTLHASYVLHPADSTKDIRVYDSRVFIPADKCQWEAGKQYTYLFHITTKANGTTDPNKPDPTDPDNPWVDPDDPRIPDTPALSPIVFDGVKVDEYEETTIVPDFTF